MFNKGKKVKGKGHRGQITVPRLGVPTEVDSLCSKKKKKKTRTIVRFSDTSLPERSHETSGYFIVVQFLP